MLTWLLTHDLVLQALAVGSLTIGLWLWYRAKPPSLSELEPMSADWLRDRALHRQHHP